jgi:predicted acyl esterase
VSVPHARVRLLLAVPLLVAALPGRATALTVHPGAGLVAVTDAAPGTTLVLADRRGHEVGRGVVDRFGSLLFRQLRQGARYVVRDAAGGDGVAARVLRLDDHPPPSFYTAQRLDDGLGYITTRDGTRLAAMVRPPLGKQLSDGPFPTVIEYSGYAAADPDTPQPTSLIASALGYATVGVNMRGSGCSGGTLELFDLPTTADGYDVVEVVAAQPWVQGGKVGMVGISFPGISQTFVAGARPPHLAAVTPMSIIADIYRAPGFPGGIFNTGFAQTWLQDRKDDAEPAPEGGQAWAIKRVNAGDTVCRDDQRLRLQTQDPLAFVEDHPFYEPAIMAARSPINWVHRIAVPAFFASAWQDEQTGGDFASLLARIPRRRDVKITTTNGVHSSTVDPQILWRWLEFLDLYVAGRVPDTSRLALIAPFIYPQVLGAGTPTPPLPADRFAGVTDVAKARRRFEADPHVRVLFENGAGSATPGLPAPTFAMGFDRWPPREAKATAWHLDADGVLATSRARGGGEDAWRPDPSVRPQQTLPGQDQEQSWEIVPAYDWEPLVGDTAVAWATPPLDHDVTIAGFSSLDLWLASTAPDTDLQVTLSEVRPDGLETYVQNGWLRASHRKLDRRTSSRLEPRPTHLARDARRLPVGRPTRVRVGLFAVAHVFRAGSRIRVSVEAPGGDRTRWDFDTPATGGGVVDRVLHDGAHRSRLLLPVLRAATPPSALPPCPGLRGEPCRTYVPAANGG